MGTDGFEWKKVKLIYRQTKKTFAIKHGVRVVKCKTNDAPHPNAVSGAQAKGHEGSPTSLGNSLWCESEEKKANTYTSMTSHHYLDPEDELEVPTSLKTDPYVSSQP